MLRSFARPVPLLRTSAIRAAEARAGAAPLMARAGAAAARWASELAGHRGAAILVLVGPGNNGGDALVAARHLLQDGFTVHTLFVAAVDRLPADAAAAHTAFTAAGGMTVTAWPAAEPALIIDGLFGIGLGRAPAAPYADWIERANDLAAGGVPILALDCPSGLDADTGVAHRPTIRASHTLSFLAGKPGLFTGDGPDHCGTLRLDDLGVAGGLTDAARPDDAAHGRLIDSPAVFAAALVRRCHNVHKGSFGTAGIVGGAAGMTGAALLAGRAALAIGSGRVLVALGDERIAVDFGCPELMLRNADALSHAALTALACGPGLGLDVRAADRLAATLDFAGPLVLDADALTLLAGRDGDALRRTLHGRAAATVLTPHPGEAARLLGSDVASIARDRVVAAGSIARNHRAIVVLKGAGSVIATPDGTWSINASGTPALASAGTGDVLTGLLVGLLAQGWPALAAAQAATHVHGRAGEAVAAALGGPVGLRASDLLVPAAQCFNAWLADAGRQ